MYNYYDTYYDIVYYAAGTLTMYNYYDPYYDIVYYAAGTLTMYNYYAAGTLTTYNYYDTYYVYYAVGTLIIIIIIYTIMQLLTSIYTEPYLQLHIYSSFPLFYN